MGVVTGSPLSPKNPVWKLPTFGSVDLTQHPLSPVYPPLPGKGLDRTAPDISKTGSHM